MVITAKKRICMRNRTKKTLGSVGVEKGIPVTISYPSTISKIKALTNL
jgi:hypothetical protein